MATKVGAGESKETDSFKAGAEAAKAALTQAGVNKCDFVLLFATVGYNQEELLKGVRSVTGNAPLSGCSGEGLITQTGPYEETHAVGAMVFSSDEMKFFNCFAKGLKGNNRNAGKEIGKEIGKKLKGFQAKNPQLLMLFADGLTVNTKELFAGIYDAMKLPLPFVGGTAGDDWKLAKTFQYYNDKVLTDSASCVLISGEARFSIAVNHGCLPLGLEKTITKAEGNKVNKIDNQPTWTFFKEYLEGDINELTAEVVQHLSICERIPEGEKTGYGNYIIRAPFGKDPDGSMSFATEIPVGTKIRIGRRDSARISNGAKEVANTIKASLGSKKPIAVIHIDCAARGKAFFGNKVKEKTTDVMQKILGKNIPWLGFFSYGEIAPIGRANYYHNETAVLCVIY